MKNPFPKMYITQVMYLNNVQLVQAIFDRLDFIIEHLPEKGGESEELANTIFEDEKRWREEPGTR